MLIQKLLKLLPGLENGLDVIPDGPVGQVIQGLVSEQVLVHQEGLCLGAQDGEVEHRHVPLSLDPVQKHTDLHAELHGVLGLGREITFDWLLSD